MSQKKKRRKQPPIVIFIVGNPKFYLLLGEGPDFDNKLQNLSKVDDRLCMPTCDYNLETPAIIWFIMLVCLISITEHDTVVGMACYLKTIYMAC